MCVGQLFRMDLSVPAQLGLHEKRWFCLFTSFFFLFLILFLKCNNNNNNFLRTERKEQTGKHLKGFLEKAQSEQSTVIMCSNGEEHNCRQRDITTTLAGKLFRVL